MGLTPLISAEWNWRVQLLSLQYCRLSLRRWPGATFLNPALAGIARTVSGSRESHAEYKEGVIRQTGKPLPPVVIADDVKRHKRCRIQPY